jgi:hypothetical protein
MQRGAPLILIPPGHPYPWHPAFRRGLRRAGIRSPHSDKSSSPAEWLRSVLVTQRDHCRCLQGSTQTSLSTYAGLLWTTISSYLRKTSLRLSLRC